MRAAEIAAALGLRRSGSAFHGTCPACGYRGFEARDREGQTLVHCHAGGCNQGAVIGALRKAGLWGGESPSASFVPRPHRVDPERSTERRSNIARELWCRSWPAEGTPVETYLRARGFEGEIPPTLRYLPNARHTETGTRWPAMIAAVTRYPEGRVVAIHRTYLKPDGSGKAAVEPNKMTLGPVGGGAVRLAKAGLALAVTEGIETGLSVLAATGIPTWAALSAGGIRRLILPSLPLASEVTVAADADPVGTAAAHDAVPRWHRESRRVRIAVPPEGQDFNDILWAAGATEATT